MSAGSSWNPYMINKKIKNKNKSTFWQTSLIDTKKSFKTSFVHDIIDQWSVFAHHKQKLHHGCPKHGVRGDGQRKCGFNAERIGWLGRVGGQGGTCG